MSRPMVKRVPGDNGYLMWGFECPQHRCITLWFQLGNAEDAARRCVERGHHNEAKAVRTVWGTVEPVYASGPDPYGIGGSCVLGTR